MARRRGSATALKASEVVAARAMRVTIHSYIGICQELFSAPLPAAVQHPSQEIICRRLAPCIETRSLFPPGAAVKTLCSGEVMAHEETAKPASAKLVIRNIGLLL